MLLYNLKCPTVNHSYQLHLYRLLNNEKDTKSYYNISFTDTTKQILSITKLENLEERRLSNHIYYTLNAEQSYDFLDKYTHDELQTIVNDQQSYIQKQLQSLIEFKHISQQAATVTEKQYTELIFINWLAFDTSYIQDIIKQKETIITNDIITEYNQTVLRNPNNQTNPPFNSPNKIKTPTVLINTKEIRRLAQFSTTVTIDDKQYHLSWQDDIINDPARFIYILGSRQVGKSKGIWYLAFETSFIPNQKILVSSFSALSASNMRDYILEYASHFPPLPNWQEAFTFHSKEAFLVNNISKSRIFFRTLAEEWKWIRWMTLNLVIVDESAFVANQVYERVLKPTITTTKWRIIALSTPDKKNWFYEWVMKAMKNKELNDKTTSLYTIDYTQNPFIYSDPVLLKDIEENKHKASIRQEYMCQFVWEWDEVFSINLADFYPELKNTGHYVLSYDPARKGKDMAWYTLTYTFNWTVTTILSWYIPKKEKTEWASQAKFLKELQIKFNAKFIMDITWVWDWVIDIMKSYWVTVHMAINYTNSNKDNLDKTYPYGSTKCYNVWKWVLVNKTMDFCDEEILYIYEYTCKPLLKEIEQLTPIKNKLWQMLFETDYFDDATNSLMINIYYIFINNLLSKRHIETPEYDPYDKRTHWYHKQRNESRTF